MIAERINALSATLPSHVQLIAVSKTKPVSDLQEAYDSGPVSYTHDAADDAPRV
jgi:uncharacterized pyridoxal phosphate-containing UPF0001 family protein